MKTLKLFNAVLAKDSNDQPFVAKEGYIIESGALWAKNKIIRFYKNEKLDGFGLNKTFHKSWKTVLTNTRKELWMEQIKHYVSTYGSNFQDVMYIPNEIIDIPDTKLAFKVIKGYSNKEMTEKCLYLLQSGIALKEDTIDEVLTILVDELSYHFTGDENINNKEAIVKIADLYGVLPKNNIAFLRYIIYKATGESLLIKSKDTVETIIASNYNPTEQFAEFGLEKLAEIFNRFKPLFLAFKAKCPKIINKISKLSKTHHKPLITNPLNLVTSVLLLEEDTHWLDNATPFALFKALSACYTRMNGQHAFAYRIRNGKSFIKNNNVSGVIWPNYYFIIAYLKNKFDFSGKKFFFPAGVEYALPTSEKMYVGNIPTGSKFFADSLAVGIYWENQWGAHDIDVSGLHIGGKIGWNASYKKGKGELIYSGDITDAPNGAVEYIYAQKGLKEPTLINSNVYDGSSNCEYKMIIGKGDNIDYEYMINPNNLFLETKCQSVQKQTILGILIPEKDKQCFVVLNVGAGETRVSGNSLLSHTATKALYQQWRNSISLKDIIIELGGKIVMNPKHAMYDFSLDKLQRDSFTKVFKPVQK
ncbi:hypothetical protein [uncultured Dokdonia sp.]|uniref:hypothetical protein n=1 Tax=uncultured Dokdonia sp. TaxID=575653 RepID=UPI00260EFA41|nr:hypothetical protein [uncultured Dokdonia sp.]